MRRGRISQSRAGVACVGPAGSGHQHQHRCVHIRALWEADSGATSGGNTPSFGLGGTPSKRGSGKGSGSPVQLAPCAGMCADWRRPPSSLGFALKCFGYWFPAIPEGLRRRPGRRSQASASRGALSRVGGFGDSVTKPLVSATRAWIPTFHRLLAEPSAHLVLHQE